MERRKRKGRIERVIGMIFILVLFLVMIINLLVPSKETSEQENRVLEQRPKLTAASVMNGDFMEQWESYMSDQFVGRNMWRSVKVALSRLGGSRMENGVYIGKDGQLLEEIAVPEDEQLSENAGAIKSFAETYTEIPVTVMLVPDAACILSDSLPAFAQVEDQRQLFSMVERQLGDTVTWVDTYSILNKYKSEKIY